jgi:hypothetical protein
VVKSLGDWAFCEGINRFVIHGFTQQPDLKTRPGIIWWGVYHQRNQTWWELSTVFHQYLARSQFLLQQGLFVADVCYLLPEASPQCFISPQDRSKFNYDGCTPEAVLTRMAVKDGRLVLPDGMSYRLLALPKLSTMTPPLLRKIRQLVEGGATIVGPRPLRSPSLQAYPRCDADVKALADELWGNCDGKTVQERNCGKGKVLWGDADMPLYEAENPRKVPTYADLYPPLPWIQQCLSKMDVPSDFTSGAEFRCIHRRAGDADLYFVANPENAWRESECAFRVSGKQPELWDPVAGTMRRQVLYQEKDGLTTLDKLISWSEHEDAGVKYYSGTGTYRKTFSVPPDLTAPGRRVCLDLGDVQVMAQVRLNGRDLGILWTPPFRIDVTGIVKAGENTLEIVVANVWTNRLKGDALLPADKRFTRTDGAVKLTKDARLCDSGLIGPVRIVAGQCTEVVFGR